MIWIVNILATMMYLGFGVIYAAGFPKKKTFRLFYDGDSGGDFSRTDRDVFFASGRELSWSYDVDGIRICIGIDHTVEQCENDGSSCCLLCSMGVLYVLSRI